MFGDQGIIRAIRVICGESREEKGGIFWVLERPHVSSLDPHQRHRGKTRQIEETRKSAAKS